MPPHNLSLITRLAAIGLVFTGKLYCGLLLLSRQLRCAENLPPGGKIIAPNHPNASDPFHMYAAFPGLLSLVQADIFEAPILGWMFTHSGQIPVDEPRKTQAYERGCRALEQGRTLMIFPEGTLNPEGKLLKAGTGPVRMSLDTGAPIVPFGIYVDSRNTIQLRQKMKGGKPRVGRWQFRGRCFIQAGEPWYPAQERSGGSLPDVYELTDRLMARIRAEAKRARENALAGKPLMRLIPE